MIRKYLELTYPTLADAQARAPADISYLVARLPGRQLAGPLSFVEREVSEGVTRGVVGFELDSPTRFPSFDPAERLAELRAQEAEDEARERATTPTEEN